MGGPDGRLQLLDQTELPGRVVRLDCRHPREVRAAIRRLAVRGAPLIGIAAAYGVVLAARHPGFVRESTRLASARPTAVNLAAAVARMLALDTRDSALLLAEARAIHREDEEACRSIGRLSFPLLRGAVLTHCNAGALATGGPGTALAGVYEALRRGRRVRVFADETRPLLQGARLTAWELDRAGADVTVLVDGAAAALLASGRVGCVFTGADRIAANGDVANKIGTRAVALAAHDAGIPFYVAAPLTTFDPRTRTGASIRIEERAETEVLGAGTRATAPKGVRAWNPAFDVTPARLVTALICERGVLRPPFGSAIAAVTGRR